jgi:hypothetical protein
MRLFGIGISAALAIAGGAALAQDLTAGKSPAQLFGSDCSACHRSPGGLAKGRDSRALASFLKEHYTTKPDSATSIANYVATFTGAAPPPEPRRGRHDADALGTGDDVRSRANDEPPPSRRRRTVVQSGEGEKPRARDAGLELPRTADASRVSRAATPPPPPSRPFDPLEQVRSYVASGLNLEGAAAAATRIRPAKPRRPKDETAQPHVEPAPDAKTAADPASPPKPAEQSTTEPSAPPAVGESGPRADVQAAPPVAPRLGH